MESFKECGWPAFGILFVAGVGFTISIVGLVVSLTQKPRPGMLVSIVGLVISLLAIGIGPLGAMHGRTITDEAIAGVAVEPGVRERIRAQGYQEAGQCIKIGFVVGALPTVLALLGIAAGAAGARKASAPG